MDYEARPVATVLVGNTDHKLSQPEWAELVEAVGQVMVVGTTHGGRILFAGFPPGGQRWLNACWVCHLPDDPDMVTWMREELTRAAAAYQQDCIAWIQSDRTEFLEGRNG